MTWREIQNLGAISDKRALSRELLGGFLWITAASLLVSVISSWLANLAGITIVSGSTALTFTLYLLFRQRKAGSDAFVGTTLLFAYVDISGWFTTDGIYGPIPYVILIHLLMLSLANSKYNILYVTALFLGIFALLTCIQYMYPAWVVPYLSAIDKFRAIAIVVVFTVPFLIFSVLTIDKHFKAYQKTLQKEHRLMQLLVDSLPSAICVVNEMGDVSIRNTKATELGEYWDGLIGGEQHIKQLPKGEQWFEVKQIELENGMTLQVAHDISEQQAIYQELQMLSMVASQTDNMVIITNKEGLTEWVNESFVKQTGYELNDIYGKKPGNILQGKDSSQETIRQMREAIAREQSVQVEIINYGKGGHLYWTHASIDPVFDLEGKLEKFISVQRDITKEKEEQEKLAQAYQEVKKQKDAALKVNLELSEALHQLQKAQTQLVHSEKMASLGVLMAGVAHEINNPLNFIHGGIQAVAPMLEEVEASILAGNNIGEEVKENITTIKELIRHMKDGSQRIADIIHSMRIFLSTKDDRPSFIKISENIDATLIILHHQYKNRIAIVKHYDKMPQIECLAGHINQLLMNLLINAIEAVPNEGQITIALETDERELCLSITDTGMGIPPDNMPHIFDAFFTTKSNRKNVGLGLTIAASIVDIHHGRLIVENTPPHGCKVCVWLPLLMQKDEGAAA